jgi:hypothetical protein
LNWEAIGAIGEIIGAGAVVATLIILVAQIRHSTRAMEESNRLERVSAIDRHSESIGLWRGRLAENEDLARIWMMARDDEELDEVACLRFSNLWIDFTNTQRANFVRARAVGASGLARQAVFSVASEANQSATTLAEWKMNRAWHELESPEFADLVDDAIRELGSQSNSRLAVAGDLPNRERSAADEESAEST